jgi:serine/threonine protein kinase
LSFSRTCLRCHQPLPELLTDGTCPSCGFAVGKSAETPRGSDTPNDRDGEFLLGSDPNATHSHVPSTVIEEPAYKKVIPLFPDIPNHTDFEVIGRGGMGTVYRAIQRPTDRTVAIKVINHYIANSSMQERFISEVRAHAKISHPGIVPIYEVGVCSHGPYFTMEYQPGGTLAQRFKKGDLDDRESARIVADAAEAVHAAHREAIIHRDIKPSNILVDPEGRVKVTDFGLAKHEASDDITQNGVIVGTFAYMSPEQASGDVKKITKLSDVYCLGSTLFQLVTGKVPHQSKATQYATVRNILSDPTPAPMRLRRDICPTLDAIIQMSMAGEPSQRYESAELLAKDLRCWLNGEPTLAKPLTRGQRVRRYLHRHRVAAAMVMLVPFLAAAAVVAKREMDPKRRYEKELRVAFNNNRAAGLLDQTGQPRWHEWKLGESVLKKAFQFENTVQFQAQRQSRLCLVETFPNEEYRFSIELCQLNSEIGRVDENRPLQGHARIGIFWGQLESTLSNDTIANSAFMLEWNEFPRHNPGFIADRRAIDSVVRTEFQEPSASPKSSTTSFGLKGSFNSVSDLPPGPWRRIILEADQSGVRLAVTDSPDRSTEVVLGSIAASDMNEQLNNQLVEYAKERKISLASPPRAWTPKLPLGVYSLAGTVAFRNATLQPIHRK